MSVEVEIIAGLSELLDVPVSADVPATRPTSFVTVEQTGGSSEELGMVEHATVAVQSWAPTRTAAIELAVEVDAAMHDLLGAYPLAEVRRDGLYNFPSPDGNPRYQAVYKVTARTLIREG